MYTVTITQPQFNNFMKVGSHFLFTNLWVVCCSLLGERLLAYRLLTMTVLYISIINRIYKNLFHCLKNTPYDTLRFGNKLLSSSGKYTGLTLRRKQFVSKSYFMTTENFVLIYCSLSQQSGNLRI